MAFVVSFGSFQGNALQTRTPANGKLTGVTVDLLVMMEAAAGVTFRYFYPCRRADYDAGTCSRHSKKLLECVAWRVVLCPEADMGLRCADGVCKDDELRHPKVALEMMDKFTYEPADDFWCFPCNILLHARPSTRASASQVVMFYAVTLHRMWQRACIPMRD